MIIKNAAFTRSAGQPNDRLNDGISQFAFVGRSNVGKSSLINMLTNHSKLARTSNEPGRTRLINYFLINDEFYFTDLPGYGYARVSYDEKLRWQQLIEEYLENEQHLVHIFLLVDIRHDISVDDAEMYNYLYKCGLQFTILATKSDKLSKMQLTNQIGKLASQFKVGRDNIIACSCQTKQGKDAVLERIEQILQAVNDENDIEIDIEQ